MLLLPFEYFIHTRLTTVRLRLGWLLGYLIPVLALAVLAHGGAAGLYSALAAMVAVYAAYEFGYLVNDTVAIERETSPTLRLAAADRLWVRQRLVHALAARALLGTAAIIAMLHQDGRLATATAVGWLALWPVFALYNRLRGWSTIPLYLLLTSLRFVLPITAAAAAAGILPAWPLLLLLYPLPSTYIAAWKQRYGLKALSDPFRSESRFRLCWHGALAALALAAALAWRDAATWVFAAACVYYLLLRVGSVLLPHANRASQKQSTRSG